MYVRGRALVGQLHLSTSAFTAARLDAFIENREAFVRIHNEALFEDKKHFYSKIVEYFTADAIGGIRVAAQKR